MSEKPNILEQLRNRKRASVPNRTDSLITENEKPPTPFVEETQNTPSLNTLEDLQHKLSQYPKTKRRSAIVLSEDLDRHLSQYCRDHQITVETFLEAAWTIAIAHPSTLKKITKEAQSRYKSRKEAGRLRRLITMLSKE
ncbi:conserved hypothetical protein [Hyella patelloides LEGE 07179]|uniref:Uncharacterized protein n=1 Tax=Hyella patelloides LEGE 07179 TaxID=945734 RepID=A0A563VVC5_9CYAN|nr:hypothetical protein [Hyella patelloides]VEP15418.1 conserved hypothetical protein [Hyella patelloides LEGE 07179]